jgi:uncharacterized membrane protein (UPF0127 family)
MVGVGHVTRSTLLVQRVRVAQRPWERMAGLLGRRSLAADEALLLPRCRSVHTWFMRFPIDLVFLDRAGVVVRIVEQLPAFRVVWARGADAVLELPAGTVARTTIQLGERFHID